MPIWHQSPKLTPRYFLETPRLFGYPIILIHRDLSSIEIEIYSSPITLKQTTKPQINSVIHTMNGIIKSNPNKLPKIPVIPL